jgi:hypothetical protein
MGLIGYRSEKRLVMVHPSQIPSAPDEVSMFPKMPKIFEVENKEP